MPAPYQESKASFGLRARFALCFATVVIAVLIAAGTLTVDQVDRSLRDAARTHLSYVVTQIRDDIEAGMSLGFDLTELRQIQDWLIREARQQSDIRSILVFDEHGIILYSTNPAEIGEKVPSSWQHAAAASSRQVWHLLEDDTLTAGASFFTNFGTISGTIALRLPVANIALQTERFGWKLAGAGLVVAFISLVIVAFGAGFIIRPLSSNAGAVAAALGTLARFGITDPQKTTGPSGPSVDVFPWYGRFEAAIRGHLARLKEGEIEISRLDEQA